MGKHFDMADYKFIGEVLDFDIREYKGLIGWIGNQPQKIYSSKDLQAFFLHDENINRLFKFEANLFSFEGEGQYEKVIEAYTKHSHRMRVF